MGPIKTINVLALLLICTICNTTHQLHADQALTDETKKILEEQGEITRFFKKSNNLELLPHLVFRGQIQEDNIRLNPSVGGEILFRQKLPAHLASMNPEERDLHIYNTMRKISSMQGIEYYSRSRERMRLLFEKSYMVTELKSKEALPDMLVSSIPEYESLVCFQEDLSFGTNYYSLDYQYESGVFLLRYSNLDSMLYKKFLKAVSPEHMVLYLLIFTEGEHLYIYGMFGAAVPTLLGLDKKAEGSFYERLKAIRIWFSDTL